MKEIKYQAFWLKDKIITSVDTIEFLQGGIRVHDGCCHKGWEGKDCQLRDFTGLKDKNGKEIYESDVVDFTVFDCFGSDTQYKGEVIWSEEGTEFIIVSGENSWNFGWVCYQNDELEVIGNIYEVNNAKD